MEQRESIVQEKPVDIAETAAKIVKRAKRTVAPKPPAPKPYDELTIDEFLSRDVDGEGMVVIRWRPDGSSSYRGFGISAAVQAEVMALSSHDINMKLLLRLLETERRLATMMNVGQGVEG